MKPFDQFNYDDAKELFGVLVARDGTVTHPLEKRRSNAAITASKFYNSDHWQGGKGFIGQMPPATLRMAAQIVSDIEAGFVSENVVQEVTETHVGGILGREPTWSFLKAETPASRKPLPEDRDTETGDSLTPWWNERKGLRELQNAATTLLVEGGVVRRLFVPRGLIGAGRVSAADLTSALGLIYFQNHTLDEAGVFTNPDTQKQVGIYLFQQKAQDGTVEANCAELSYLNEAGDTVCRVVKDKGAAESYGPYQLGGLLLIHQLDRRALITPQVQSNQRALNLAHTMMMRNVNMAGSRERIITNAQVPMERRRVATAADEVSKEVDVPAPWHTGAGAVNVIMGHPIRDPDTGEITGYTNPNVTIAEPSSVETFVRTIEHFRAAIYNQTHQRHVLIVDKADTSGRAREVARREFERSLKETKIVVDASGRWQLEAALRLAAQIAGRTAKYLKLRADFNCLIDAGEPDPEKQKVTMELRKPGGPKNRPLISDETARNWIGVEDSAAELAKIEGEEAQETADLPPAKSPEELSADKVQTVETTA